MVKQKALVGIATIALILAIGTMGGPTANAAGPTTVLLGRADTFAILAGSTVTNTGPTVVNGDLGLSPGTSVTGFPPGLVNGTQHVTDAAAANAKTDLLTAYNDAAGRSPTAALTELGGTTKTAGVYGSPTFGITTSLTLDAQGDTNAVFIFQTASTLITGPGSSVVLTNGAQACNVFWKVGSSATLDTTSSFKGTILANTSITVNNGVTVVGRLLAGAVNSGAVTLINDTITKATCAAAPPAATASPSATPAPAATTSPANTASPAPTVGQLPSTTTSGGPPIAALGLLLVGLGAAILLRRHRPLRVDR